MKNEPVKYILITYTDMNGFWAKHQHMKNIQIWIHLAGDCYSFKLFLIMC